MIAVIIPIVLLLLILYCYWVWNKCSNAFPFAIIFLIEIVWGTLSIFWIDRGVYITEQLRKSFTTGAAIRYVLLMAPFAYIFPKQLHRRLNKSKTNMTRIGFFGISLSSIVWGFCIFVVAYIFADLIISGTPLLSVEIEKSKFYSTFSLLPLAGFFHQMVQPFVMLVCGMRFIKYPKGKKRYTALIFAGLILLIQILLDNKFYGLYDYVIWFAIPLLIEYLRKLSLKPKKKLPWKYIILGLVILGILLGICYNQYARNYTNPLQALLNRIFSLQSHTFWGTDLEIQNGELGFDIATLLDEITAAIIGVETTNADYGLAKIMYYVTTNIYANNMLDSGFMFSGSFITVAMSYSGYILTFLLSVVFGYIAAYICTMFARYLYIEDYIILYFMFLLYRRIYEYFRVGNLAIILNWKMLVLFFGLLLLYHGLFKRSKRRDTKMPVFGGGN